MKTIIFTPIMDYLKTRRKVVCKFIFPFVISIAALVISFMIDFGGAEEVSNAFADFIGTQISIVAILISFSVAIITILVSADNKNIQALKETFSESKAYKHLNGKPLTLFQILLSNIAYNTVIQIIYLMGLIALSLINNILPVTSLKYVTAICIFFISHILLNLLESVAQMYLTFWAKK